MSPDARRLRERWQKLWKSQQVTSQEMKAFAEALGRERVKKRRGHPKWKSSFPGCRTVTIPDHPGAMKIGTKNSILLVLKHDVEVIEREEGQP